MTTQLDHRTVWRWHFYAGLFCIPFVLWLSVTGTIFLFHPQIQHWFDRPYDHLSIGQRATANAQVQAALAAVPGFTLDSYQLPYTPASASEVLVDKGTAQYRVYIHPQTLAVLHIDNEDHRVDVFMSRLHGELLIGKYGSWVVELAASWAVVMIVTGLFLWWPTNTKGLAAFSIRVCVKEIAPSGRTSTQSSACMYRSSRCFFSSPDSLGPRHGEATEPCSRTGQPAAPTNSQPAADAVPTLT
jgi:uncharacterized iron-regulated membrane protein